MKLNAEISKKMAIACSANRTIFFDTSNASRLIIKILRRAILKQNSKERSEGGHEKSEGLSCNLLPAFNLSLSSLRDR